jgi:hypothetical protein
MDDGYPTGFVEGDGSDDHNIEGQPEQDLSRHEEERLDSMTTVHSSSDKSQGRDETAQSNPHGRDLAAQHTADLELLQNKSFQQDEGGGGDTEERESPHRL